MRFSTLGTVLISLLLLGLMTARPLFAVEVQPLKISRITPSGEEVGAGQQIVLQFNQPMVALGEMGRESAQIPVSITPALNCQWRWLDSQALACQLDGEERLRAATQYRVQVAIGGKAEFVSLSGQRLSKPVLGRFTTVRPQLSYHAFNEWLSPTEPSFNINFSMPVTADSVAKHAFIQSGKQRYSLRVIDPYPKEGKPPRRTAKFWRVEPLRPLPADAKAALWIEPGVRSLEGPLGSKKKRLLERFATFPPLRFLGIQCYDNHGEELRLSGGENKLCNPLASVSLRFSAPVTEKLLQPHLQLTPDLAGGRKDYDPWQNSYDYSRRGQLYQPGKQYLVALPERLKAYQPYQLRLSAGLQDEFGRPLRGAETDPSLSFGTDHRPASFELEHRQAVLESGVDSDLPLVVTNFDAMQLEYRTLTLDGLSPMQQTRVPMLAVEDVAYRHGLKVRDLLKGRSGVVQGMIVTDPALDRSDWSRQFSAQVTPFHIHAKAGHYNTLVWVTDLATGQPVKGVKVSLQIGRYQPLSTDNKSLSEALTSADGIATLKGIAEFEEELNRQNQQRDKENGDSRAIFMLRAEQGDDMALLPFDYDFSISSGRVSNWQVSEWSKSKYGHLRVWGMTAQGIYKAGDSIDYKLFVRDEDNTRLMAAPRDGYTLSVTDPQGREVEKLENLQLSEFGTYAGQLKLSKSAAVGWYYFTLRGPMPGSLEPLRVLVSDFTPAPFKVRTELNGKRFKMGDELRIDTAAELFAGGPYGEAPTRISVSLSPTDLPIKSPLAEGFEFDTELPEGYYDPLLHQSEHPLDKRGELRENFKLPDNPVLYGRIRVESAVRDDRGKSVASSASADYAGRDRYVGVKLDSWLLRQDDPTQLQLLVVDEAGQPAAGSEISVLIERKETTVAKVKGPGNAYLNQYQHRWLEESRCSLTSAATPQPCDFTPQGSGEYRLIASIKDTQGRAHQSRLERWGIGGGRVIWEEAPGNRLEISAEQASYQVGDTARYLIKNPFPGAKALITLERYGVIKQWVKTLEKSSELLEIPVDKELLPGFYLSVLVVSPRVDKPLQDGVDLGKPSFRLGYVATEVSDPDKALQIKVMPQRDLYKPGEAARVDLEVQSAYGNTGPLELAVAVVDEAVFALLHDGRDAYDPYKGLQQLDSLDLENYNLLMRLVGRQMLELKGANPGGGGGAELDVRSVFKYLAYWNPALHSDDGKASVEFELPDNLTGWRVMVLAINQSDLMGLGEGSFKVNRDTELRPLMPNQLTAGDQFQAGFSVMNRTDKPRRLQVTLTAEGALKLPADQQRLSHTEEVELAPFERKKIWLPVTTQGSGELKFSARAGDGRDSDGMTHSVAVKRLSPTEVAAEYVRLTGKQWQLPILFPAQMAPGIGALSVTLSPTVIGNIDSAFEYMRDYPYACWEQRLSKGVMASHYRNLRNYLPKSLSWPESGELPSQLLTDLADFQAPNGGMAYYVANDQRVSPYLSAYTALALNWLREAGQRVPQQAEQRLHDYLLKLLRYDNVPDAYGKRLIASVRAVALAALAANGKVTLDDLQRLELDGLDIFALAQLLDAALQVDGGEALAQQLSERILGRGQESAGKLLFNDPLEDDFAWIHGSADRGLCAALSAFTRWDQTSSGHKQLGEIPFKLARTVTQQRGSQGYWRNTQDNLFCMNALIDYAQRYEQGGDTVKLEVKLDQQSLGRVEFMNKRSEAVTLSRVNGDDAGQQRQLVVSKQGDMVVYLQSRFSYLTPQSQQKSVNAGMQLRREYRVQRSGEWQLLKSPLQIRRGELLKVDLFITLPSERYYLVVDDPVAGGLEPVNRQLATASQLDSASSSAPDGEWREADQSFWSFYHQELRFGAARFFADYLPKGNYHLSYTAQAIATGEFQIMPAKVMEMYDEDVYGRTAVEMLIIEE